MGTSVISVEPGDISLLVVGVIEQEQDKWKAGMINVSLKVAVISRDCFAMELR